MTFTIDTDIIENDEVQITEDANGDLALKHVPSGTVLTVDQDTDLSAIQNKVSGLSADGQSADLDSLSTEDIAVGGQPEINYWPPVRIDKQAEVNSSSPATSYTSVSLSAPAADATHALLAVGIKGDGTSSRMGIDIRENGVGRSWDIKRRGWAGHGDYTVYDAPIAVPLDGNNEVEYKAESVAEVLIQTVGYF